MTSETKTERPKVSKHMIAEAAKKLATENCWDEGQAAEIAECYHRHMDGYELAKALETRYCWHIQVMDVDTLDGMDLEVREFHQAACKEWALAHNIQPPLPIGTMTTRGEITGIYEHDAACYLIRAIGETSDTRKLIVRFEDARSA